MAFKRSPVRSRLPPPSKSGFEALRFGAFFFVSKNFSKNVFCTLLFSHIYQIPAYSKSISPPHKTKQQHFSFLPKLYSSGHLTTSLTTSFISIDFSTLLATPSMLSSLTCVSYLQGHLRDHVDKLTRNAAIQVVSFFSNRVAWKS